MNHRDWTLAVRSLLVCAVGCQQAVLASPAGGPSRRVPAGASPAAGHIEPLVPVLAVPPSDATPPLPTAPPGVDPERVMLAASICAAGITRDGHGKMQVGCRSHPPFVRPEQKPDGKLIEHVGDPRAFCRIQELYRGSFTEPGKEQILIAFDQCMTSDDAAWDSALPGSVVLAERVNGRWVDVATERALDAPRCLVYDRSDGRDVLVCRHAFGAPPDGGIAWFDRVDFARPPGKRLEHFGELTFNDFPVSCEEGAFSVDSAPFVAEGVVAVEVESMLLEDTDRDGAREFVVKMSRASIAPGATLEAKISARCRLGEQYVESAEYLPPTERQTLVFRYDGERFVPTPPTAQVLLRWRAASPQRWFKFFEW